MNALIPKIAAVITIVGSLTALAASSVQVGAAHQPLEHQQTLELRKGIAAVDNKTLVVTAITELFTTRDPSVLERYWSTDYIQHSTLIADGIEGARAATKSLPATFRYQLVRAFAEGDLVVTHGMYFGLGSKPLIAFDLWRTANGKIAEHWDALMPQAESTASGNSEIDGQTEVRQPAATQASKALIERFLDTVIIPGKFEGLPTFFDGDNYVQHNPLVRNGVSGLFKDFEALGRQGRALVITKRHRTVAEGEFVFTQSAGTIGTAPAAFYDLWRVENGKIAEHWDVFFEAPATMPHGNGLF
jgi:predicted SnoaL-like aldol condensation-catalyzing enzyme